MPPNDVPAGGHLGDYLAFWGIWLLVVALNVAFFRVRRGRAGLGRLAAGNAAVLLLVLWTLVVAGETYVRYIYDETDQNGLTMTSLSWFQRHVKVNSRGLRDREWDPGKRPGTRRVACVGDSFTMGWGVPNPADAYPQRIGAALEADSPGRFEVRNYGVPGFATSHEVKFLGQILPTDSLDRVILGYCINDADDLFPPGRAFDRNAVRSVPFISRERSFLADFLWFRLHTTDDPRVRDYFTNEIEVYQDADLWARQVAQLRRIEELCRLGGARLTVVVFPFFHDWGPAYRFGSCHDRVVEAWTSLRVEVIDLRDAYQGLTAADLAVNRFDAHPNARAHEIAARTILDRVFRGR